MPKLTLSFQSGTMNRTQSTVVYLDECEWDELPDLLQLQPEYRPLLRLLNNQQCRDCQGIIFNSSIHCKKDLMESLLSCTNNTVVKCKKRFPTVLTSNASGTFPKTFLQLQLLGWNVANLERGVFWSISSHACRNLGFRHWISNQKVYSWTPVLYDSIFFNPMHPLWATLKVLLLRLMNVLSYAIFKIQKNIN
jgi:hypothetical protein